MRIVRGTAVEVGDEMTPTDVKPSPRLVRAADAERREIERRRQALTTRREKVLAELAEIDVSLSTLGEREVLLARLLPSAGSAHATPHDVPRHHRRVLSHEAHVEAEMPPGEPPLRGPAIREAAVAVLASSDAVDAVHYRAWYEMLLAAGYRVAGKDSLAVFLTQITRSPVVKKSTQAGVYALDREAPLRLRRELAGLQMSLREIAGTAGDDLGAVRDRREAVLVRMRQTERALVESEAALGAPACAVAG
jgi:hypothetical protein